MTKIIDADGHIVEPRSLWQEYIEPKFRGRVPQVAKDNEGIDRVKVEGKLMNDRRLNDPAYDPFWTEAQELDCTIAIHSTVGGDLPTVGFDRYPNFFQR